MWENNGFFWGDVKDEAIKFYYNKSHHRKMDNYFDSIKILSIHNINKYDPKEVKLENMNIKIPEIINQMNINENPIKYEINDIFHKKEVNVISINSEIIDKIKNELWKITEIKKEKGKGKKMKEKEIIKQIIDKENDICFLNIDYPIWKLFDKIKFKIIILETEKNVEQMHSILESKKYVRIENLYYNLEFLIN